ncbi:MAG: 30S ribosomal protein S18 [Chloroflexi bacterium]|nr:30S ribosomal protein S18 [Chloroflexota bacterium]
MANFTGRREKRKYVPKRKVCPFCVDRSRKIDYKEVDALRRFISDRGKMEPRHRTGVCAKHQRILCVTLKRARFLALLPYTGEHARSAVIARREQQSA